MSVRKLLPVDWEAASKLAKEGVAHCGVPSSTSAVSLQYLKDAYLDGSFGYEAYGRWTGNVLNGMALVHRSRYQPCYFVTRVYTWEVSPGPVLCGLVGDVAYEVYHTYGLSRWLAVNSRWDAAMIDNIEYEGVDLRVPALTRPPYSEFFNILMARQIWPEPLTIKHYRHY